MIAVSEPTIEDKIELLVRSVLEAVDVRLGEIRDEVHTLAGDVRRQHDDLAQRVGALERRAGNTRTDAAQDTAQQLERIEAMHQRHAVEIDERFADVHAAVDRLNGATAKALTPTDNAPIPLLIDLDSMTAPLRVPSITGQHPVMMQEPPSTPPIELFASPTDLDRSIDFDSPSTDDMDREPIDMTQLADLLSERLGQLSLPPAPH